MSQSERDENEKAFVYIILFGIIILMLNIYYYAHPLFASMGLSARFVTNVIIGIGRSGLFVSPSVSKAIALVTTASTLLIRHGSGRDLPWPMIISSIVIGMAVYFLYPLPGRNYDFSLYIVTTVTGYVMCCWGTAMIARRFSRFKKAINDVDETFDQCQEKIETADSINLRTRYKYKQKMHKGWINVVNPFRATMILGTPGSGKSFSVYNPFIEQMIDKGYCLFCYDYKYPDLTEIVYNETLRKYPLIKNPKYKPNNGEPEWIKDPKAPSFYVINFKDPRYSNRCNPINKRYIEDPADSAEIADVIFKNVAPETVEKEDFFSRSAKVYIDACIYFLSIYEDGKYCTFPHLIELMGVDYKKVFCIMSSYDELETKIKPFAEALNANAQDQLQGQIASATIPLNKMASPVLYWVLSGDDFSLDINNPDEPKIVCVGNDPDRQAIYGTTLALFTSRMFKLINHKGKRKCGVLLDELPTIFIKGLDNLIATARSNKVAIVLGAQDKSQLVRDYSQKEADVIFNTVGNIFAGQVNGKTAEDLNKSLGKEYREQQSQTRNEGSDSVQVSFHQEELMPISKIETLTQGFFFGKVADNNDKRQRIKKKFFCGEILIDVEAWLKKLKSNQKLPIMTKFNDDEIYENVHGKEMSENILRSWCIKKIVESGIVPNKEDIDEKIQKKMESLTKKEKEKILNDEAETMIKENVQKSIKENFERIREEVREIIRNEMPDEDDRNDNYAPGGNPLDELEG